MTAFTGKVLITGAGGFVGTALRAYWRSRKRCFAGVVRTTEAGEKYPDELRALGDLLEAKWQQSLEGIDTIVHLAGRAHVMREDLSDPELAYTSANVALTQRLAEAAIAAGVRRFVYASSVKVNGERALPSRPYTADDPPAPQDPYGRSKLAAERYLRQLTQNSPLEVVVLRFPLVYGAGVKGNFRSLMEWIARGRLLPFGAIHNCRSLLCVGNLVSAIDVACWKPSAAGKTYLLADIDPISTPDLCRLLASAMELPCRMIPVPVGLLRAAGTLSGKQAAIARLTDSLVVDSVTICQELDWIPPIAIADGLFETARWFHAPLSS